jgi:phosphoribosyl 1,2-cyclic phosphate phosphodiesterase
MHGPLPVLGFRIGDFAYCTDCSVIPDESWPLLEGLDVLILDALRIDSHPTHFSIKQAIEVATRVGAKRTFFTHMAHQIKHADVDPTLPDGMHLTHDGLRIEL